MMNMSSSQSNHMRLESLPFDSIVEILSWLPVESLLRFKRVRKQCRSLIEDYSFILKNMDRTSTMRLVYPCTNSHGDNFEFVSSCAGLCLEKTSNSRKIRIRNPATHQVLYLPDPPPYSGSVYFAFNLSTRECKVVCFYWVTPFTNVESACGLKVITIGKDEQWRSLELPDQNKHRKKVVFRVCCVENKVEHGVFHVVQVLRFTDKEEEDMYLEVHSLDIWSEHFTTNILPKRVTLNLKEYSVIKWHNCLSFGYMKQEFLDFWVLQDYKEQKWSPKIINFPLKGNPERNDGRPLATKEKMKIPTSELDLHISEEVNYRLS